MAIWVVEGYYLPILQVLTIRSPKKKIMLSKNKKAASVKYNTNNLTNFTADYKFIKTS